MSPSEFLDQILPAALTSQHTDGIPASFTLAQAALESSWGARAPSFNLFGVKADSSWHGPIVQVDTHEFIHGTSMPMKCPFRAYGSWLDCIKDHAEFFKKNPRYAACFKEKTGEGWAKAVAAAGYATDPDYANKLIAIIRFRNLTRFDKVAP